MTTTDGKPLQQHEPEALRIVPSILGVGLDDQTQRDVLDFDASVVKNPAEALERLNIVNFDLLLGGPALDDDALADMAWQLDRQFPCQRWAIVARELDPQRERMLRALGSVGVFDDLFTCLHFACPRGRFSRCRFCDRFHQKQF